MGIGPPGHDELVDGHTIPEGLELAQVSVFVRHGERTPVRNRLAGFGGIPKGEWNLCGLGRTTGSAVADFSSGSSEVQAGLFHIRKTLESHQRNTGRRWKNGECFWGELTDLGRQTTLRFGRQLRRLYIEKLGFITDDPRRDGDEELFFRATSIPRALETAEQIIRGLYPPPATGATSHDDAWTPTLVTRLPTDESLYLNTTCRPLRKLDEHFANEAAAELNDSLKTLDPKLGKFTRDGRIRVDGHPRVNGILDTLVSAHAHNIPLPQEFHDPEAIRLLEGATVYEWFNGYAKSRIMTRLAMGRLFGDLRESMLGRLEGKSKLKLGLYSCHDTSIGGILSTLGCPVDGWPKFTSHLTFEVFRPTTSARSTFSRLSSFLPSFLHASSPDAFVRLRYNSHSVKIPACAAEGNHRPGSGGELCTWKAFSEAVENVAMTAEEWDKACTSEPTVAKSSKREG